MTYVLLQNDMNLVVSKYSPIYRGDNLSQQITFLIPAKIGTMDTMATTVFLTYVRPDGTPDVVILQPSSTMYDKNHYQYCLPVTCKLSRYPGKVYMWLSFYSGNTCNPVIASTGDCSIFIQNKPNMDNCIADDQLTALYQLKLAIRQGEADDSWSDMDDGANSGGTTGSGNSGSSGNPDDSGDDGDFWEDM